MKIEQRKWTPASGWKTVGQGKAGLRAQLVFIFADRFDMTAELLKAARESYPDACQVAISTSGNIIDTAVEERVAVSTAIEFEKSRIEMRHANLYNKPDRGLAVKELAMSLPKEGLRHIFVLADGYVLNGSLLIESLSNEVARNIPITGGLAGDAARFEKTVLGINGETREGEVILIGFYGESLRFGYGSVGGWDPFGIDRKITKSEANVLYTLDDIPALDIYKKYLGEYAKDLPASALLFPLSIRMTHESEAIVRTILDVDEASKSLIFAGEIPQGWYARLMKANFERLIDGAYQAALLSLETLRQEPPDLAILISCVGRKMVLHNRIEEELEAVREVIGQNAILTGFYSYGEIAPSAPGVYSQLHNQTMTITAIKEE